MPQEDKVATLHLDPLESPHLACFVQLGFVVAQKRQGRSERTSGMEEGRTCTYGGVGLERS